MKDINLKSILASIKKIGATAAKHMTFGVIIVVLFAYLFMVWRISQLATAEPSPEDESTALATSNIPKIDKDAIKQISELEKSSAQVHSFFDAARNNPFSE